MWQSRENAIGAVLAFVGTAISMIGVFWNNCLLQHAAAMIIWSFSNAIFIIYFYGRIRGWWNGGFSDAALCGNYIVMFATGIYGMFVSGIL